MKLRLDLLEHLTAEDILEEARANQHRYKALFSDLSFHRRKEASSAVAHFITGVLDEEAMVEIVETLSQSVDLKPGDRVKTLRGTTRGIIMAKLEDGRLVWRADGSGAEWTSVPESLVPDVH
jgi:hypothetical protein